MLPNRIKQLVQDEPSFSLGNLNAHNKEHLDFSLDSILSLESYCPNPRKNFTSDDFKFRSQDIPYPQQSSQNSKGKNTRGTTQTYQFQAQSWESKQQKEKEIKITKQRAKSKKNSKSKKKFAILNSAKTRCGYFGQIEYKQRCDSLGKEIRDFKKKRSLNKIKQNIGQRFHPQTKDGKSSVYCSRITIQKDHLDPSKRRSVIIQSKLSRRSLSVSSSKYLNLKPSGLSKLKQQPEKLTQTKRRPKSSSKALERVSSFTKLKSGNSKLLALTKHRQKQSEEDPIVCEYFGYTIQSQEPSQKIAPARQRRMSDCDSNQQKFKKTISKSKSRTKNCLLRPCSRKSFQMGKSAIQSIKKGKQDK